MKEYLRKTRQGLHLLRTGFQGLIIPILLIISSSTASATDESTKTAGVIDAAESAVGRSGLPEATNNYAASLLSMDPADLAARSPFVQLQTNSQGTLLLDYRFTSTNAAAQLEPVVEITPQGAIARTGRHIVEFDGNLRHLDAVTIHLPDGGVLQGRPSAISISDADGSRVWLGEVQDSQGESPAESPNQVIYRDAFTGIAADVRFNYTFNEFEQDVILKERPLLPAEIDVNTARLEIWTEFAKAPDFQRHSRKIELRPANAGVRVIADDETFNFGLMQIVAGKAFHTKADANRRSNEHAPVAKQWIVEDGRSFLIETADYLTLLPELERLPQQQAAALKRSPLERVASLRGSHKRALIASVGQKASGVVIDYRLVTSTLLNLNFGAALTGNYGFVYKTPFDYWNGVGVTWQANVTHTNLFWSDGLTRSGITVRMTNAPGNWGNSSGNPMMDSYYYPHNGGNITVGVTNIPVGQYDFYIYGAWGGVNDVNGKYALKVGGQNYGLKTTVLRTGWAALNWNQGEHYALFTNVTVGAGQSVLIEAMPGGSTVPGGNIALLNGLQIVPSGYGNSVPTISLITDQSTIVGTAKGPIQFTIGDIETSPNVLVVTANSGNTTLLPNANITLGGTGADRTITLTPAAGQIGSALITVTVSDGSAQSSETFVLTVLGQSSYTEIAKSGMIADSSTTGYGWFPTNAINGLVSDPGWHNESSRPVGSDWLRVNLGATYNVARVQYHPRQGAGNGTFLEFEIYVTGSSTTNLAGWGPPVASGTWTWPNGAETKTVNFAAKQGQYVIFRCVTGSVPFGVPYYASAGEVWVYQNSGTDSDGDGLSDAWENQHFGDLNQNSNGDWDGDGATNLQEFQSGRDPKQFNGLIIFTPLQ